MKVPTNPDEKISYAMYRILNRIYSQRLRSRFAVFSNPLYVVRICSEGKGDYAEYLVTEAKNLIGIYTPEVSAQAILDDLEAYFGDSA